MSGRRRARSLGLGGEALGGDRLWAVNEDVVDLHAHILPRLDDGAPDIEASLAMARTAVADGVHTVVATPHVNFRYDPSGPEIERGVEELNALLRERGVPLTVVAGAEVAVGRLTELPEEDLRSLTLGGGPCLLVESPYAPVASGLDEALFDLQLHGLTPLLAHPERSPLFHSDIDRLRRLVERGIMCSVTAGSLAGAFGSSVRAFASRLMREELVHDVSSDAHDAHHRPPRLSVAFERQRGREPLLRRAWLTGDAPRAILAGEPLPPFPAPPSTRRSRFRLFR